MVSSVSTIDRAVPQSLRTVRGSSSVFVQVTTAPALIVKNMAIKELLDHIVRNLIESRGPGICGSAAAANPLENRLRDGPVYSVMALDRLDPPSRQLTSEQRLASDIRVDASWH
jgi:hypothetical protein